MKFVAPSKEHIEKHYEDLSDKPFYKGLDVGRNVCHGSDSVENAKKEISLWFKGDEVISWKSTTFDWIYEKP
ncbi:MAG: hypothetical protein LQ340_005951 [Diploschistes diacapsis]|nr:MAG: hypothetical protein LQ340_005951 [Diploschistes diacapsis]